MFSKAKPPTKRERERMDKIASGACILCGWSYPEVHHLIRGNKRRGHRFTIGLCAWHHRGVAAYGMVSVTRLNYGPSLAEGSKPFHARFGSDDELLAKQDALIGWVD